jgi:hypothetical protein
VRARVRAQDSCKLYETPGSICLSSCRTCISAPLHSIRYVPFSVHHNTLYSQSAVLPNRREEPRLQHNYYPRPHSTTHPRRWRCGSPNRHLLRQIQRPNLAHHRNDGHRRHWLPHQRNNPQPPRALHLLLPLRIRRVFRQLCHLGLGIRYAWPNAREKSSQLSIVNVVSMASFIYTPYLYPKEDGPKYVIAMSSNASFAAASILAAWALRVWLQVQNKRLSREGGNVFYAY